MIIDAELKNWLDDRSAQSRTEQAAHRFAHDWNQPSPHRDFDAAMRRLLERCRCRTVVVDTARALLADEAWVDALVARLAAEMRADPWFEPPFRALHSDIHTGLLVYEDDHLTMAAGVSQLARLARRKQSGARQGLGPFHRPDQRAQVPESGRRDASPSGNATRSAPTSAPRPPANAGRRASADIADGETIVVDGRRESLHHRACRGRTSSSCRRI